MNFLLYWYIFYLLLFNIAYHHPIYVAYVTALPLELNKLINNAPNAYLRLITSLSKSVSKQSIRAEKIKGEIKSADRIGVMQVAKSGERFRRYSSGG